MYTFVYKRVYNSSMSLFDKYLEADIGPVYVYKSS